MLELSERARTMPESNLAIHAELVRELEEAGVDIIKLNIGQPDGRILEPARQEILITGYMGEPWDTIPEAVRNEIIRQERKEEFLKSGRYLSSYTGPQGLFRTRKALIDYFNLTTGLAISPEDVIISSIRSN